MAGASLLALIDDIAVILDDVSVMTKVAAKKTAGVLGDDLALNANQVQGVKADRELPVVWAVTKGSFINKLILVPVALLLSAIATKFSFPWLIYIPLMIGGLYLCYEGAEKVIHKFWPHHTKGHDEFDDHLKANIDENIDLVEFEKNKITGAIRTDFILSAEIIVIALGSTIESGATFTQQVLTLSIIAIAMTIGVYGLVAGIVKLDDLGLWLHKKSGQLQKALGAAILAFAPKLMKFLSIAGTIAMFLVGGHIIAHNLEFIHHIQHDLVHHFPSQTLGNIIFELIFGFAVGCLAVLVLSLFKKIKGN